MKNLSKGVNFYRCVICLLMIWYGAICLIHYLGQRPLWNDELAVFSSIQVFKPHEFFTQPLRSVQVFPHLYLFVIRTLSKCFDYSLLSLRFLPFVFMMAAFLVWLKIAEKEIKDKAGYITFMLCWIGSVPLVYYAAELKQYSLDVLIAGLFVWTMSAWDKLCHKDNRRLLMLAVILMPMAVLFSYPAYFFLVFPLWNLIHGVKEKNLPPYVLIIYLAFVSVCAALSFLFDVRLRPVDAVTNGFNDYFIATHNLKEFFQTLGEGVNNLFSRWFVELPKIFRKLARAFLIFGLVNLFVSFVIQFRKSNQRFSTVGTIALVAFIELAIAAALKKYPFGVPRTALFLCPMILILTIQGILSVKSVNRLMYYGIHAAFIVYLLVAALGIAQIVLTQPLIAIPELWAS